MRVFFSFCISLLASLLTVHSAIAQQSSTPSPGYYSTSGGWGNLEINLLKDGTKTFNIFALGANAHMCSLAGIVRKNIGHTIEGAEDPTQDPSIFYKVTDSKEPTCLVLFSPVTNGLTVTSINGEVCGGHCGMRAGFEGTYIKVPPGCILSERKARQTSFLTAYRAKTYSHAYDTLNSLFSQCHEFMSWIEIDSVRNDLAITQYHLGHKEACLDILKDTIGATQTNEEMLKQNLPPADFDAYSEVAEATWYNLKLCRNATNKKKAAK